MTILTNQKTVFLTVFLGLFLGNFLSYGQNVTISQDSKFEELLSEKRRINASLTINDRYKVQIFTGDNENSRKALNEFKKTFKEMDGTIVFNTPFYKVWVGNFKTRIEAERNLVELKKMYPNSFLIKPNK